MFSCAYSVLGNHLCSEVYLKYRNLFYHIKIEVSAVKPYLVNGELWTPRKKVQKRCSCTVASIYLKMGWGRRKMPNWDAQALMERNISRVSCPQK